MPGIRLRQPASVGRLGPPDDPETGRRMLEVDRCTKSVLYWMENYLYTIKPQAGAAHHTTKFDPYPFQAEFARAIERGRSLPVDFDLASTSDRRHHIISKSRQLGLTTELGAIALHAAQFRGYEFIPLVSQKEKDAQLWFEEKIMFPYQRQPDWLKRPWLNGIRSKEMVTFSNGSQIIPQSSTAFTGRGAAATLLLVDEAATIQRAKLWIDLYASCKPTVTVGGQIIVNTTHHCARRSDLADLVEAARAGQNTYKFWDMPWHLVPGRTKEWLERERMDMPYHLFASEYLQQWIGAETPYLPAEVLVQMLDELYAEPVPILSEFQFLGQQVNTNMGTNRDGTAICRMYKPPRREGRYIIGFDAAKGTGRDWSAGVVWDISSPDELEVPLVFHSRHVDLETAVQRIFDISDWYNECSVIFEENGIGQGVIGFAAALGKKDRLWRPPKRSAPKRLFGGLKRMGEQLYDDDNNDIRTFGWWSSSISSRYHVNKLGLYAKLHNLIMHKRVKVYDAELVNEWLNIAITDSGKIEGNPDDMSDAAAIALADLELGIFDNQQLDEKHLGRLAYDKYEILQDGVLSL